MFAIVKLLVWELLDCFKSRARLEAEGTVLCHQLNILRRKKPKAGPAKWFKSRDLLLVW